MILRRVGAWPNAADVLIMLDARAGSAREIDPGRPLLERDNVALRPES
jgi:hypothetical protein